MNNGPVPFQNSQQYQRDMTAYLKEQNKFKNWTTVRKLREVAFRKGKEIPEVYAGLYRDHKTGTYALVSSDPNRGVLAVGSDAAHLVEMAHEMGAGRVRTMESAYPGHQSPREWAQMKEVAQQAIDKVLSRAKVAQNMMDKAEKSLDNPKPAISQTASEERRRLEAIQKVTDLGHPLTPQLAAMTTDTLEQFANDITRVVKSPEVAPTAAQKADLEAKLGVEFGPGQLPTREQLIARGDGPEPPEAGLEGPDGGVEPEPPTPGLPGGTGAAAEPEIDLEAHPYTAQEEMMVYRLPRDDAAPTPAPDWDPRERLEVDHTPLMRYQQDMLDNAPPEERPGMERALREARELEARASINPDPAVAEAQMVAANVLRNAPGLTTLGAREPRPAPPTSKPDVKLKNTLKKKL
jgi:hypothetical protein